MVHVILEMTCLGKKRHCGGQSFLTLSHGCTLDLHSQMIFSMASNCSCSLANMFESFPGNEWVLMGIQQLLTHFLTQPVCELDSASPLVRQGGIIRLAGQCPLISSIFSSLDSFGLFEKILLKWKSYILQRWVYTPNLFLSTLLTGGKKRQSGPWSRQFGGFTKWILGLTWIHPCPSRSVRSSLWHGCVPWVKTGMAR